MKNLLMMVALAGPLLLAACGDGGSLPAPMANDEVPASATASPAAYSGYAGSLAADENAAPLEVDRVDPPTSETAEPIDLG